MDLWTTSGSICSLGCCIVYFLFGVLTQSIFTVLLLWSILEVCLFYLGIEIDLFGKKYLLKKLSKVSRIWTLLEHQKILCICKIQSIWTLYEVGSCQSWDHGMSYLLLITWQLKSYLNNVYCHITKELKKLKKNSFVISQH